MGLILLGYIWSSALIVALYVLAHGITAFLVFPLQEMYLGNITVFASLMYLPQGVRVLGTWIMGWKAIPSLLVGQFLSQKFFLPDFALDIVEPELILSSVVGATAAVWAFEVVRLFGPNLYAGQNKHISWRWLLFVGAIASLINSMGQSFVFSGSILPTDAPNIFLSFAIGDLVGLIVCMLALMLIFRWMRFYSAKDGGQD
ncbi:hypothetical protein SAMN05444000_12926 [Shimia gijangensis]|uniref:Uncharacterized protein n=1 Tax=Shimia gijangensis TaxID=1470563 RepID=A0A1M6SGI6_9RHOB|nr:hypothetical protein [Shimia gijangensis]SHK43815.1 hypothetical protein SAMN05444000_12926 [Shimia gijangensis]